MPIQSGVPSCGPMPSGVEVEKLACSRYVRHVDVHWSKTRNVDELKIDHAAKLSRELPQGITTMDFDRREASGEDPTAEVLALEERASSPPWTRIQTVGSTATASSDR